MTATAAAGLTPMRIVLFLFSKGGHPIDEPAWGWFQHHLPTGERIDIALRMHFGEISGVPPTMHPYMERMTIRKALWEISGEAHFRRARAVDADLGPYRPRNSVLRVAS
jgi:hypothetical protein